MVATGGYADRQVIIRSLASPESPVGLWCDFDSTIEAVQFNPDGTKLLIAELFGRILILAVPSMETILDLQLPRKIGIQLSGARWAGADVLAVYGERLMRLEQICAAAHIWSYAESMNMQSSYH